MFEDVLWFLAGTGVLFALVAVWVGIHYWVTPHMEKPDGKARIAGRCGDTMEICLSFEGGCVIGSAYWTDGCAYSLSAVCAAANLAKGKDPDEILEIDARVIQEAIGGLPKDHMHCARLAAEALQGALHDYMLGHKKTAEKDTCRTDHVQGPI